MDDKCKSSPGLRKCRGLDLGWMDIDRCPCREATFRCCGVKTAQAARGRLGIILNSAPATPLPGRVLVHWIHAASVEEDIVSLTAGNTFSAINSIDRIASPRSAQS